MLFDSGGYASQGLGREIVEKWLRVLDLGDQFIEKMSGSSTWKANKVSKCLGSKRSGREIFDENNGNRLK